MRLSWPHLVSFNVFHLKNLEHEGYKIRMIDLSPEDEKWEVKFLAFIKEDDMIIFFMEKDTAIAVYTDEDAEVEQLFKEALKEYSD